MGVKLWDGMFHCQRLTVKREFTTQAEPISAVSPEPNDIGCQIGNPTRERGNSDRFFACALVCRARSINSCGTGLAKHREKRPIRETLELSTRKTPDKLTIRGSL